MLKLSTLRSKVLLSPLCCLTHLVGYRLIDCASDYGNEKEVGEGIGRALADGLVKVGTFFCHKELSAVVLFDEALRLLRLSFSS